MRPRGSHEQHRASTPLELFFDLCFVVAVARAGARLVHALAEGHVAHGVANYLFVFFAIWWAWMNFTWFASAYDTDDALYRVMVLLQIAGVLVLAAGIARAFDERDYAVVVLGYVIMRVAQAAQWLRAALGESGPGRTTALRYASGLVVVQVGWTLWLLVPEDARMWLFVPLALADIAVPVYAERNRRTTWHPHHIAERYGLFTLICLGESIAAATVAVTGAVDENEPLGDLLPIAGGGLLVVFGAFWVYFAVPIHQYLNTRRRAFVWGYGHYVILASAAAIGAGMEVGIEQATGHAHISAVAAAAAVTVPAALFLVMVWLLHARHHKRGVAEHAVLPVAAGVVLLCTFAGHLAVLLAGITVSAAVATGATLDRRKDPAEN
jgi:low temperature requirement protein LtrA